ncbi:MAG TPA: hypothetical protein DEB70_07960 [Planctomycetaceae bacterium]|nr:hypothetical protein [Planctomycetaceae bacterium]
MTGLPSKPTELGSGASGDTCQKGTSDAIRLEITSGRASTAVRKARNLRFLKKIPDLVQSGTKVASCVSMKGVAARTAHCMTARSVEYAFEGASCGKANGVRR